MARKPTCIRLLLLVAFVFVACATGDDPASPAIEPRGPRPVLIGIQLEDQFWLGEIEGDTIVRQLWVESPPQFQPGTWFVDGGKVLLPDLDGPDRHGFRIWEVDLDGTQERRPTPYARPALTALGWDADGSLLHLYRTSDDSFLRVVPLPEADPVAEVSLGFAGAFNFNVTADGTRIVVPTYDGSAVVAELAENGWSVQHQVADHEAIARSRLEVGLRRGVVHRLRDDLLSSEIAALDLASPDLAVVASMRHPEPVDVAMVSPDDRIALFRTKDYEWRLWDLQSDSLHPVPLDVGWGGFVLLPSQTGTRIVNADGLRQDGEVTLPWYDLAPDGTLVAEGTFTLAPPPLPVQRMWIVTGRPRIGPDPWGHDTP